MATAIGPFGPYDPNDPYDPNAPDISDPFASLSGASDTGGTTGSTGGGSGSGSGGVLGLLGSLGNTASNLYGSYLKNQSATDASRLIAQSQRNQIALQQKSSQLWLWLIGGGVVVALLVFGVTALRRK